MELLNRFQEDIARLITLLGGSLTEWQAEAQEELKDCITYHQEMTGTREYKSALWRTKAVASRLRNSLILSLEEQSKLPQEYYGDIRR